MERKVKFRGKQIHSFLSISQSNAKIPNLSVPLILISFACVDSFLIYNFISRVQIFLSLSSYIQMAFPNNERVSTSFTHLHDGYNVIYDVFVSFRGEDTRYNFTDRLYQALNDKGLTPFIDDDLTRGTDISDAIYKGIKSSRTSIIILSKNYATSRWCLDELAMILDCRENGHLVLPVFYRVNPSEVRKQEGNFGSGFIEISERFDKERVQRWKTALTKVANLSGWEVDERYVSK